MEKGKKKDMMEQEMPMMQQGGAMQPPMPEMDKAPKKDEQGAPNPVDDKKRAQVMKMLDGLKQMPPEQELVGMIAKAVKIGEDEARAIVDEYKASKKMGMGGAMEYEGGGQMKLMRDPKDMVGMTMAGGAKIVS